MLNARDRDLFNFLYEVKVANSWQVKREIYPTVSKTILHRRLNKLIKAEFIKRVPYFDEQRGLISAYTLSKNTMDRYILCKEDDSANRRCHSDSITHDIFLTELRHHFKSCKSINDYFTENAIQSGRTFYYNRGLSTYQGLNGDALAVIDNPEKNLIVAIEYEHTIKYSTRYAQYFKQYMNYQSVHALLYIVRDKKMLRVIQREEKNSIKHDHFKVYYAVRDDLFNNPNELVFTTGNGEDKFILTKAQ